MTLPELRQKIKDFAAGLERRDIYIALAIILVGLGSFGLGRLSRLEERKEPIRIEQPAFSSSGQSAAALTGVSQPPDAGASAAQGTVEKAANGMGESGGKLVASRGGSKYHFPWCSGAQRISEENKIWFDSVEDARRAGYAPASNCKGLK